MQNIQNLQKINNNKNKRQPHIALSHENYEKLKQLGTCGMSFNDVLTKILAHKQGAFKIKELIDSSE